MAANKGGYKVSVTKDYLKKLKTQLDSLKKNINNLENHINAIEKGNGKNAYWSGKTAVSGVKRLRSHYNNDVEIYNAFADAYDILYDRVYASARKLG